MKKTALAALLATTVALAPWQAAFAADAGDFLHGQRLYALGDYGGALSAWQPLAQEGDVRAQYSMAVLYLKGRGVPRDVAKARDWAGRAAAQGYKPGQRLLQSLQEKAAKAKNSTKTAVKAKRRKAKNQMSEMERIETAVEDLLRQIAGRIAKNGALEYSDPRAEQMADAIQVTIPDIVIHAGDGSVFDIGTVVAHVRRRDARFDDITLALPGNVRIRQADGTNGRIAIAKRLAKLRWDRQLKTSTEFEFRLSELVFSLETGGEMGRVGEVLVRADVLEKKGLWTGPMQFALNKVNISDGADSTLRLGQFNLILDLRGLNLPAMNENTGQEDADGKTGGAAGIPPLKQILGLAKGVGLRAEIKNFAVQHPAQGDVELDQAVYGLDLSSDDGKLLNLVLTTSHYGLSGTGGAAADGLVPRDLDVVLALESLPSETVVNVGVAAVIEVALLGKLNSGPQVFERLRQELSAAGTVLRIKRASISAPGYKINMSGSLLTDNAAKAGIVGGGDLRISGLEKLLAALGPKGKAGSISGKNFPPLAALVKKGQPIDGGAGQSFSLTIRPDGQFTVNGEPVLSLVPFDDQARQ